MHATGSRGALDRVLAAAGVPAREISRKVDAEATGLKADLYPFGAFDLISQGA